MALPRIPGPFAVALGALALAASGCSALSGDTGGEEGPTVAAGFHPLAWVAEQVAGRRATVVNLTTPGQDPHGAELSIRRTAEVAGADLVLLAGGLQAAVDQAVEQNAEGVVLDTGDVVDLQPVADHEAAHDGHDHGHDHGHDEEQGDGHGADGHGDEDPHFWLDPLRMADVGDAVAEELAALDPDRATDYRAAADDLRDRLTTLDDDYTTGLSGCERNTVVVSHDAFGYLARYGLVFEPIAGLSPGAEPTPADLQHLQRVIDREGVTTVFTETLAPAAMAESLATDLGLRTAVLDPLEGPAGPDDDHDYVTVMRDNLAALQEANGC